MVKKKKIQISGMHCRSCEMLVEEELLKIKGVRSVDVSQSKGVAEINYKGKFNTNAICKAVEVAGYFVTDDKSFNKNQSLPWFSDNFNDYLGLTFSIFLVLFVYLLLRTSNFSLSVGNNFSSLPV